jgi:hypothetical protein
MPSPRSRSFRTTSNNKRHLAGVKAGSRLVENQDLAGQMHGPGNRDDLLNGDRVGGQVASTSMSSP